MRSGHRDRARPAVAPAASTASRAPQNSAAPAPTPRPAPIRQPRHDELNAGQHTLILVEEYKTKLCLAARNLPYVDVLDLREVNPLSLIRFDKVVATEGAIKALEERLS